MVKSGNSGTDLDIAVKTLYLEMLNHDVDFAKKLYIRPH